MFVGILSKKIVGFGVAQNVCMQCNAYRRANIPIRNYPTHRCKNNHDSSSAAMETSLVVRLQNDVAKKGARLSMCVGDGDTHVDYHLNASLLPELSGVGKCLDLNHLVKNLKKCLSTWKEKYYRSNPKALTAIMVAFLCGAFSRVVYQHRIEPKHHIIPLEREDILQTAPETLTSITSTSASNTSSLLDNAVDGRSKKRAEIEETSDQRLARFLRCLIPTIPIVKLRDSSQDLSVFDFDFAGLNDGSCGGKDIEFLANVAFNILPQSNRCKDVIYETTSSLRLIQLTLYPTIEFGDRTLALKTTSAWTKMHCLIQPFLKLSKKVKFNFWNRLWCANILVSS